jgi:hypothetical protein
MIQHVFRKGRERLRKQGLGRELGIKIEGGKFSPTTDPLAGQPNLGKMEIMGKMAEIEPKSQDGIVKSLEISAGSPIPESPPKGGICENEPVRPTGWVALDGSKRSSSHALPPT